MIMCRGRAGLQNPCPGLPFVRISPVADARIERMAGGAGRKSAGAEGAGAEGAGAERCRMGRVLLFSSLLIIGLVGSQVLPALAGPHAAWMAEAISVLTLMSLAFIMIHVGYEFEIDKKNEWQHALGRGGRHVVAR